MNYRAAMITGASQRLGRAMALSLAARGTAVAVHYSSSKDAALQTVKDIQSAGGTAAAVQADLLDETQTAGLVDQARDALNNDLDVLINNASIFEYDTIETASLGSWSRHMGSNLRAPFVLMQKFAQQVRTASVDPMKEQTAQACVINMIDQRVRKLTPEFMTYTLAKSALWTLTQTGAQALAPNIRVNAIGPGPTMIGARQSQDHFERQRLSTILQRGADSDGIVDALQYLLDAQSVTGQLICVDGGQHLGWKTPDILGVDP